LKVEGSRLRVEGLGSRARGIPHVGYRDSHVLVRLVRGARPDVEREVGDRDFPGALRDDDGGFGGGEGGDVVDGEDCDRDGDGLGLRVWG